jgi:hypothetical protein
MWVVRVNDHENREVCPKCYAGGLGQLALLTTIARGVLRLLDRAEPRVDAFVINDLLAAIAEFGVDVTDEPSEAAQERGAL